MGKTILIMTGSPRKGGNSTILAQALARGAKSREHEVVVFDTAVNHVKGCIACEQCWSKGEACVFDDGFRKLSPHLIRADVLVLAMPVYWFGFPAQLKAAVDKMYSFLQPASPHKLGFTEAVLLMTGGDTNPAVFTGSINTYKGIMEYMEVVDRGIITVTDVHQPGDIIGNPALARAEALGAAL